MSLPNLNHAGELPIGIHQARIGEVIAQFGSGTTQRENEKSLVFHFTK